MHGWVRDSERAISSVLSVIAYHTHRGYVHWHTDDCHIMYVYMYTAVSKHGKCVPFKMYIYNMSYTHQRRGSRLLVASHRFLCTVGWCGMFSARDERSKTVPECKCTTSPIGLIFTWKNVYCIQAKEFSNPTNPYKTYNTSMQEKDTGCL